jgi:FkbM family methyltransferase
MGSRALSGSAVRQARKAVKLARIVTRPAARRALRAGVGASVEHLAVPFAHEPALVLDAGASRGQFAAFACDRFPTAAIVSFEPLSGSRERLLRAVPAGRVTVHPVALGARSGEAALHVSRQDDSSSLLSIGERQGREFPGTEEARTELVAVRRLDEMLAAETIERPCLLKVDVQGFELEVLRGAERTLEQIDEILVECSFVELYRGQALAGEVVAHLVARGFRLAGVTSVQHGASGEALQADFRFVRA